MMTRASLAQLVAALISLARLGIANAQSIDDDFEADTFDSFWTISEVFGSVFLSTDQAVSGAQSAAFTTGDGGFRDISLGHQFDSPVHGTFAVWLYDSAPGVMTSDARLFLTNASDPNARAFIGPLDFDADVYYVQAPGLPQSPTDVQRTAGWHYLVINTDASGGDLVLDGACLYSWSGDFPFDKVQLRVNGPGSTQTSTYYFDDFSFDQRD